MGRVGKQPAAPLLSHYGGRPEATQTETSEWERTAQIIERFFNVRAEELP
jgi:hypothetical protein